MYIPDKSEFQPSDEALNKWLATRKPTLRVGGVLMPGFFSDIGNSGDTGWFTVGLIGELAGLIVTVWGGINSGGIILVFAIIAIVMFVFLDYVCAVKLHRNKALECRLLSESLLTTENVRTSVRLDNERREGRFVDFLLGTAIIVIALFKTVGVVFLGLFNNLILYVPFAVLYLIVAYVHIRYTGYYFAYRSTERAIEREHHAFGSGDQFAAKRINERFATPTALTGIPIKHNPHSIENNGGANEYVIKTTGVLTDDDILGLIAGQDDTSKIALFKAARKLQLENLKAGTA